MSNNHELEQQDSRPTTSDQNSELDKNELDTVAGGFWLSPLPPPGPSLVPPLEE